VNPLIDLHRPDWRRSIGEMLEETVVLVAELGGTLAGEHGDGRLRTPFLHRLFAPEVIQAFSTVKQALDPDGILNPGVVVPIPGADPLEGLGEAPAFSSGSQGPEGLR
jgi:FAD/FMN-containing dehydrogenase